MDLQLDVIGGPGRRPANITVALDRELTLADVKLLEVNRETQPSQLKRITDRHHAVARLLAAGMKPGEVAALTGYTLSTISILQNDPTFEELLNVYRANKDMEFRSTFDRLAGVTNEALDLIAERLEEPESREKVTLPQAMEIAKLGADRIGHGPSTTNTNLNVHLDIAERMKVARERARAASGTKLIEGQALEVVPQEAAE